MARRKRSVPEWTGHSRSLTPTGGAVWETASAAHKAVGLWVRAYGYQVSKPNSSLNDRRLGNYAAVYVSRGEGTFDSPPTGSLAVGPGTLFWLFPEVPHNYSPFVEWAEQWIIFDGPLAETFERQGYLSPARPLIRVGENPLVADLYVRVREAFTQGGPLAVPLATGLLHQLIVCVHALAADQSRGRDGGDPAVDRALKIIEAEATQGLQPEALAERLHVGYSTLRRRFKQQTGYSVKEYVLRAQLQRAKDLLAFSPLPVEQVAAETGFADPFYFSRMFKAREGVSPSAFRERQRSMSPGRSR